MLKKWTAVLFVIVVLFVTPAFADQVIDGKFGPGALYRLVHPTVWNGTLVLYAHGEIAAEAPVQLPSEANLIVGLLVPHGFAVAFTSFSENGWAVKDGAQRTEQLLGIFKSKFGSPSRVYIAGASLGGLIAIKLAETDPGTYSGALPVCAVAGGSRREFDYLGNVRALFDFFYPGVLPGNAGNVPAGINIDQQIKGPATAALINNPDGALAIAAITQTPVPFASAPELGESIVRALAVHAAGINDILDRTHGHPVFDNRQTVYTSATLPAEVLQAINLGIQRFDATRDALEYLEHYYTPSGNLHIPMLMLSDSRDPEAPGFNQTSYESAVAQQGSSDLLVNRQIDRYGHCEFSETELGTAFAQLVLWAQLGIKPTP